MMPLRSSAGGGATPLFRCSASSSVTTELYSGGAAGETDSVIRPTRLKPAELPVWVAEGKLTLGLLRDGHAQPLQVDAVMAADAGRAAAEGMQRDGADDERQLQTQLGSSRNIDANLGEEKQKVSTLMETYV